MAKKKTEPERKAQPEAKPVIIPVRLGLTPEEHHSLRMAAAHANVSMTDFVKSLLLPVIMGKEYPVGKRRKYHGPAGQGPQGGPKR